MRRPFGFNFLWDYEIVWKRRAQIPPVDRPERYIVLDDKSLPAVEMQLSGTIVNLPGHTADSIGLLLEDGRYFAGRCNEWFSEFE